MRDQALVSVLIVNWNGRRFLKDCLSSLRNQTYKNHEIILVDNGSIDGSVNFVRENFPEVKVVENEVNIGPAAARNLGFQKSSGEYIAFLDNDTEADPNCIMELMEVIESDQTVGAAQSKLLSAGERDKIWATGEFVNYFGDAIRGGAGEKDNGQYTSIGEIFNPITASAIFPRKVFEEVGMFDPTLFFYYEDVDIGWRIWLRGYRVVFVPKSVVYHIGGGSSKVNGPRARAHATFSFKKNCIAMMIKNYSFKNLMKCVPARIVMEIARVRRNKSAAAITIRAILWNLTNLKSIWKQRLKVQYLLRRVPDEYLMKKIMGNPSAPNLLAKLFRFDR